ncbi:MAG: EF-hand domain-containing protein, partial [Planctomycetota bacterium]|nr:EF-hand domain-containing protein [Planctomycetota bacterium]
MNRIILILTTVAAVATTLPSQGTRSESSPDAWKFLSQKYDKNKDGKITAEEHGRSESSFRNLDQNGDGVITAADIPAGDMRGRRSGQRGGESRRGGRGAGGGEGQRGGESRRGSRGAGGGGNMPMAMLMGRFFSRFVDDDGDGKV